METVAESMRVYSKKEVSGAAKAREMLCKIGYPPVSEAKVRSNYCAVSGSEMIYSEEIFVFEVMSSLDGQINTVEVEIRSLLGGNVALTVNGECQCY